MYIFYYQISMRKGDPKCGEWVSGTPDFRKFDITGNS